MKIYLSADIEGITDVTVWDEADIRKGTSAAGMEQMTAEVAAACQGALEAGASELVIKDAHDTARNLIAAKLPREARLVRGWAPHPLMMMQELDETFQAAALIGYHSRVGSGGSPLAHTMTDGYLRITLNGQPVSEFLLSTYSAALFKVPVVFVSGDAALCQEVKELNSHIGTVAVKEGVGNSTVNIHPELAVERIRLGVAQALRADLAGCLVPLPDHFSLEIQYKDLETVHKSSFYPGVVRVDPHTLRFEHYDFFEVMRFMLFA